MSKYTAKLFTKANAFRTPIAVGTAGLCATAALGTGVALAADGGSDASDNGRVAADQAEDKKAKKAAALKKQNGWTKPVDKPYTLSASYGNSGDRWSSGHSGQDFAVPTGTKVEAAHKGTVVTTGWGGSYGNQVVIKHANGQYTQYAHLSSVDVKTGESVKTDEQIGKSGNTGNSSGPHLHFEVRTSPVYGSAVDPVDAMGKNGVKF